MTGRREEKKQQTFNEIVSTAARSFGSAGYDATSIEAIAAEAGVAAGTVYNYFGTKHAILMAIVTRDTEQALIAASSAVDLSADDPVDALMPVIMTYVDAMITLGRDVLKELFNAGLEPSRSDMMSKLISLDARSIAQIAEAFALLQAHGMTSDTVDPGSAAILIYSVVAVAILMFVSIPETTVPDVDTTIRNQLTLVFQGIGVAG